MTTESDMPEDVAAGDETTSGDEKSFFARGAMFGLVGGALVALLVISAFGSVVSLFDDVFGSATAAAADEEPVVLDPVAAAGKELATSKGCTGCHTDNGADGTGPTWKGLGDTTDESYIRTAIVDPNSVIVDGFTEGIMPADYSDTLSGDEIDSLVAYILSL